MKNDEFEKALSYYKTQKIMADDLGCSEACISRMKSGAQNVSVASAEMLTRKFPNLSFQKLVRPEVK